LLWKILQGKYTLLIIKINYIRVGVREAIEKLKMAHIKIIMVTGDQPLTAASIAHQIGIIEDINDTPKIIQKKKNLKTVEEAEEISNVNILLNYSYN
jgi:sodium/potassium-transporting ATPase subunit alpha